MPAPRWRSSASGSRAPGPCRPKEGSLSGPLLKRLAAALAALLAGLAAFLFGRRTGHPATAPHHAEDGGGALRGFALEDPPRPRRPRPRTKSGLRSLAPIVAVLA